MGFWQLYPTGTGGRRCLGRAELFSDMPCRECETFPWAWMAGQRWAAVMLIYGSQLVDEAG